MFLKKLGQVLANVAGIVAGYGPVFTSFTKSTKDDAIVAVVSSELAQIQGVVASVEAFGAVLGTPGADKARAAGPLVGQIVLKSMQASGHELDKDKTDKFLAACTAMSGAYADIMDCFKGEPKVV